MAVSVSTQDGDYPGRDHAQYGVYPVPPRTMPKTPEEATLKEVQYPDDLPGEKWTIVEYAYYDAQDEDDAQELPEDAQYGLWLRARWVGTDEETWLAAPRSLREQLLDLDLDEGDHFEVFEVKKGPGDQDPYHVEMDQHEPGDPA